MAALVTINNMAEEEKSQEEMSTGDKSMSISRTENPEITIDLQAAQDMSVWDELGNKIKFGSIFSQQKTIIVFVRHFLCFMCKEYVEDLTLIPEKRLKDANVQLAIIGCAKPKFIKSFRQTTGCKYPIYCDPEGQLYKAMGCIKKLHSGNMKDSKHVKSSAIMGILSSTWRAMRAGREWQGDVNQQGGAFILGPGNEVQFKHLDQSSSDHASINDLLVMVGADPVNFTKDMRVLSI